MRLRLKLAAVLGALVIPLALLSAGPVASAGANAPSCWLTPNPSRFVEAGLGPTAGSVAFVLQDSCSPTLAGDQVKFVSPGLNSACHDTLSWFAPGSGTGTGESFTTSLDSDGNATVVVWGGPSCASSTDPVSADVLVSPFTTASTTIKIAPPKRRKPSLSAFPASETPDTTTGSVEAIFYASFASVHSEQAVEFSDDALFNQCGGNIEWVGADEEVFGEDTSSVEATLDGDGNTFVVALAGPGCSAGRTTAEVSLLAAPYTTRKTIFSIL